MAKSTSLPILNLFKLSICMNIFPDILFCAFYGYELTCLLYQNVKTQFYNSIHKGIFLYYSQVTEISFCSKSAVNKALIVLI